jgi:hypothetical protein
MEIGPIPGIRTLPAVKAPPADPRLSAVFDIESPAKPGDDAGTGSRKKASGAEEDEDNDLTAGAESSLGSEAPGGEPEGRISYFA